MSSMGENRTNMEKNIAVVGTGYWGKNLVRNFYNLGSLHTVCDTSPEAVKKFVDQYPGIHGTHRSLLFYRTKRSPELL